MNEDMFNNNIKKVAVEAPKKVNSLHKEFDRW